MIHQSKERQSRSKTTDGVGTHPAQPATSIEAYTYSCYVYTDIASHAINAPRHHINIIITNDAPSLTTGQGRPAKE